MAQAHVSRRLDEDLRAEHGLSLQEYVALLILVEAPEHRLRMGRLAELLTLSKSGATPAPGPSRRRATARDADRGA